MNNIEYNLMNFSKPITDIIQDIKQQGYPEYVLKGLRVIYQRFFLRLKWEESEFLSAFKVAYDTLRFKV